MSTRELAYNIVNKLTDEQLQAFVTLFGNLVNYIPEVEPDEWDKKMIADSKDDNDEAMSLDDFAKELGFNPNELQL
ncbi:MAG: hypothetical protein K2I06_03845 [Ruminococcus sp.]|nr:hypothetical protein [Ruminococcus sp.]